MIKVKINAYSHGAHIHGFTSDTFRIIASFLDKLSLKTEERRPHHEGGGFYTLLKKRFFGMTEDGKNVFIHKHSIEDFLHLLKTYGITEAQVEITQIPPPEAEPASFEIFDFYVDRDHQLLLIPQMTDDVPSRRVDLYTGGGKLQPLDARIKVPGGWSTMGDMHVGSVITAPDGKPTEVTGVFPHGMQDIFDVEMEDGRTTQAGLDHLWKVHNGRDWEVITTAILRDRLDNSEALYLPLVKHEDRGPTGESLGMRELHDAIAEYGKVPDKYMHGSPWFSAMVMSVICGYSKNTLDKTAGQVVLNFEERFLAEALQYLFRAAGGYSRIEEEEDGTVTITSRDPEETGPGLKVTAVRAAGRKETQCISVAHSDHLYVTDDFIVTHNTYSALKAAYNRRQRFAIMLGPKYFGLWKEALEKTYVGYKPDENPRYVTISGSKELKKVIDKAVDRTLDVDIVLIANTTYRNFIETYEKFGDKMKEYGYNATPLNFHATLGIGSQMNDEFQDDPGLAFRIDIFTNIQKQNYLSATPFTGDEFVTAMIDKMLPPYTACTIPKPPKYIDVVELLYSDNVAKTDYLTPFKNTYNHARYEKRMLKAKRRLKEYMDKIAKVVKVMFLRDHQPGQKMLILCATVDFINILTNYLRVRFPDKKIGFYYQGVDYGKIMSLDVIVSTIKSSGTGVDIPNLKDTFLLHSTNSKKDNIQILGRTRPLIDFPEITPRLIYTTCTNITQHMTYSRNKRDYFRGRIRESRVLRL